jgi:hypothetical protein
MSKCAPLGAIANRLTKTLSRPSFSGQYVNALPKNLGARKGVAVVVDSIAAFRPVIAKAVGAVLHYAQHGNGGILDVKGVRECIDKHMCDELLGSVAEVRDFAKEQKTAAPQGTGIEVLFISEVRGTDDLKTFKCPRDLKEPDASCFEQLRNFIVKQRRNVGGTEEAYWEACRTQEGCGWRALWPGVVRVAVERVFAGSGIGTRCVFVSTHSHKHWQCQSL